jgi:tetratricopeptide (TPR) repeat protein
MSNWGAHIGRIVADIRKKRRLRQEDLADANISASTISRIEKGQINESSKLNHLLAKLGLDVKDLQDIYKQTLKKQQQTTKFVELAQSSLQDEFQDLYSRLDTITQLYQLAIEAMNQKNYHIARSRFLKCINRCKDSSTNIPASAYNNLAYIYYKQNNIHKAIKMSRLGLQAFDASGKKQYIQYSLLANLAMYLHKIGQIDQAEEVLSELWIKEKHIQRVRTKSMLYIIQSQIYTDRGEYDQALDCTRQGLEFALANELKESALFLWSITGAIARRMQNLELSEFAFCQAVELKLNESKGMIYACTEYAKFLMDRGKWEEAKSYLDQAKALAQDQDDLIRTIQTYIALGEFYQRQDNAQAAIIPLNEAKELARKHRLYHLALAAIDMLLLIYKDLDQDKFNFLLREKYDIDQAVNYDFRGGEPDQLS